jgi:hypothetical protein
MAYDNLGYLIREGLVDPNVVYNSAAYSSILMWGRYKSIMDEVSRWDLGPRAFENFEYLAHEMWRIAKKRGACLPVGEASSCTISIGVFSNQRSHAHISADLEPHNFITIARAPVRREGGLRSRHILPSVPRVNQPQQNAVRGLLSHQGTVFGRF